MQYRVLLTKEATADFRTLDGAVRKLVARQLKYLEKSPYHGCPLGNMRGFDLTGFYKLYGVKKSIRIVYRVINTEVVVEVLGIGKRADFEISADIARRLLK